MGRHAQGDADGAAAACAVVLNQAPRNSAALMMLAELAIEGRDWDRAIERAGCAAKFDPGNALCHFTLGRAQHAAGRPAQAKASYETAVRLRSGFAPAHCNLAIVLLDLGETEAAWESGLRAVELDWRLAEAHMTVGRASLQLHHPEEAEAALRQAVIADPGLGRAQNALGLVLQRLGRFEEAIGCHREAARIEPELAEAWAGLGMALRALGRFDEAIGCFRQAIEIAPDFGEAHRDLAMCRRAAASESEIAGMRAIAADPANHPSQRASAGYALGKFLDDFGNYDEAFAAYAGANALCRAEAAAAGFVFDPGAFRGEIDAIIETYCQEFFADRAGWGIDSELPVFVVGHFRSGTTLTEQILASHPSVFGAGELPHIARLLGQIAAEPQDAKLWTKDQIATLAEQHLADLQRKGGKAIRVVDKLPQNVFSLGLVSLMFPRAKIICCHRDARDNVLSCFFQRFSMEMSFATDLADCGRRHLETERMADHWRKVLPVPLLDLNYEELVADFEAQARRLIDFIGLEWDAACLSFHETERPVNTPSTWQVRQPIYASSVGRWRNYERHLGPLFAVLARGGTEPPTARR